MAADLSMAALLSFDPSGFELEPKFRPPEPADLLELLGLVDSSLPAELASVLTNRMRSCLWLACLQASAIA